MPESVPAFPPFRRSRLADQAATALREAIQRGVWGSVLPGEHELARRLGISRPSVHAALSELAREGLIAISKGRRSRVLSHRRASNAPPVVCVVRSVSRESASLVEHPVLLAMRAELASQGVGWEELVDAKLNSPDPGPRLERLTAGRSHVCWVTLTVPEPVQRWFQDSGLPVLVLGSCYEGVRLPSVDVNYRAVGWHAAGCMARLGHRTTALVLPHDLMPGDVACREGFAQGLSKAGQQISIIDVDAGQSALQLQAKLDWLIAHRPRPTAILTLRPVHTQTAIVHLLRSGLRIPEDISLVSRDTDNLFELGAPELTRYRNMGAKQARRAAQLVQTLLSGYPVPRRPILITPAFVAGKTLGRAPAEG